MKDFLYDKKGSIYVSIIFMSLIILIFPLSLLNILVGNNMAVKSNNDNYRAGYIVESILELKIEEIMELCDQATDSYLADLQTYDMGYAGDVNGVVPCNFFGFHNYIANLASDIESLSISANNPFEEYKEKHYYKVDIKCDLDENLVSITSSGGYNRARKFINVELELPEIEDEYDEYGLLQTVISPAKVTRYYQTVGL